MADKGFTEILLGISSDIGDIKGDVGKLTGKVDQALSLHRDCPARLGYDKLKEKTSRLRVSKNSDSDMPLSIAPLGKGKISKTLIMWIMGALLAAMSGAAFTGYMFAKSGAPEPKPVTMPDTLTAAVD